MLRGPTDAARDPARIPYWRNSAVAFVVRLQYPEEPTSRHPADKTARWLAIEATTSGAVQDISDRKLRVDRSGTSGGSSWTRKVSCRAHKLRRWARLPIAACVIVLALAAAAPIVHGQTVPLAFRPVAAQYSSALDRIVMISATPDVLHIFDPESNSDTTVPLGSAPISLSVSPDGQHAAVGGSTAVYYVDLRTASVQNTYNIGVGIGSVLLANTELYIMPVVSGSNLYNPTMSYVDLGTGQISTLSGSFNAQNSGVNPVNGQMYQAVSSSPTFLYRLEVNGSNLRQISWPYFSTHTAWGTIWFSPDGTRIYTGNGAVFNSSVNPATDMTYVSTLPSGSALQTLAESAARSQVAYIAQVPAYSTTSGTVDDAHVNLLDSQYLVPAGRLRLTPFHVGSTDFAAHGRWVFFKADGTNLYVLKQADFTAALTSDFALQTIPMQNSASCAVGVDKLNVRDGGDGGLYTANLSAGTDCTFSAAADSSWITLVSGTYGSGNTPLVFEVRRNSTNQPRTGSITVGGQTIAVVQDAPVSNSAFVPLSFNVVAGDYDKALDRFVLVSAAPNELHIFDPVTNADRVVSLGPTPLSLSLSADGTHAAVGHDGWLSYVDLANAQVLNTYVLQDVANGTALGTNGYAYTFQKAYTASASSLNLNTGVPTQVSLTSSISAARVGPSGHSLYVDQSGLAAYNLVASPTIGSRASPYLNQNNGCGGIWFTEDGTRLLGGCGNVLNVSDNPSQDLVPAASMPLALGGFAWADDSQRAGRIAVIPGNPYQNSLYGVQDTSLQFYSRDDLTLLSQAPVPSFAVAGKNYPGHGHVVSWNSSGSAVFVLEQADSAAKLASSYAISSVANPNALAPCVYSIDASAIAIASITNGAQIAVPGPSPNCSWSFTSDVNWLTPRTSSEARADAGQQVWVSVQNNQLATPRTGHIVIGDKTLTVTQNPAGCTLQVQLTSDFSLYSDAVTQAIPFVTGDNCAWTATTGASWITIDGPHAGTGSATVSISVAENTTGSNRYDSVLIGGQSVLIFQLATPRPVLSSGLGFMPITPCRLVDTREATGPYGGPIIAGNTARDFAVPLSPCGIPASALAFALNVTVVPSGKLQYVTVSPSGGERPFVSTLNSFDGRIKANAAIVPAGAGGSINVYATEDTHVVIDITGYFTETASSALGFVPVQPCRVMDTRNSDGPLGGPFLPGEGTRTVPVRQSPCNLGTRATAYSLNVTAVPRGPLDYLTAWPAGQTMPWVSTLNAPTGTFVANAALLQANYGGSISVFAKQDTDLVIDTNGYFVSPVYAGLRFYPTAPCRALDTRTGNGPVTGASTFDVGTACNVPARAQAVVLNATVVPDGPLTYLTLWPAGRAQPFVSTLNAPDAEVTSNMAIVPVTANRVSVFAAGTTEVVLDVFGYFAP